MMIQPHIIQRLVVRPQVRGDINQAREIQEQILWLSQSPRFLAALDSLLSQFDRAGEWVELNKVELTLPDFNADITESDFIDKCITQLKKTLYDAIPDAILEGATVVKSSQEVDFDVFIQYLKNGYLDSIISFSDFDTWVHHVIESIPEDKITILITVLKQDKIAQQRLFYSLKSQTSFLILKKIHHSYPLSYTAFRRFRNLLLKTQWLMRSEIFEVFMPLWLAQDIDEVGILLSQLTVKDEGDAIYRLLQTTREIKHSRGIKTKRETEAILNPNTSETAGKTQNDNDPNVIFIKNAGIVLLHPFLKELFERCRLVKNGAFISNNSQQKALLLFYYLSTGSTKPTEPDVILPKVLVGMPINAPQLRGCTQLTNREKNEAESLLQNAIEHWKALKNTSPDGLREGFLQREGKLESNPTGGMILTVEQKPHDMLLAQLPYGWGINIVKFQWMKEPLQVVW